jgi:DNA-binding GntR family transcriptional regulator
MTLCARFAVSRPVVREALRQLSAEGLVESVPNQGTVVATLTYEDARDLYEIRALLEARAGELFATRASAQERADLSRVYENLRQVLSGHGLAQQLQAKNEFYEVLLRGAGNKVIRTTLLGIHARVQILRSISMQAPGRLESSTAELCEITRAAVAGDADAAGSACRRHVEHAGEIALAALRERMAAV